jgi:hypothetical protein
MFEDIFNLPKPLSGFMDSWVADRLVESATVSDDEGRVLHAEMQRCATELAGGNPTPIEAKLAETAAICWFALRLAEAQDRNLIGRAEESDEPVPVWLRDHDLRRIERAHRRLMATVRTLETVRRLAVSTDAIKGARRNVSSSSAPPRRRVAEQKGSGSPALGLSARLG